MDFSFLLLLRDDFFGDAFSSLECLCDFGDSWTDANSLDERVDFVSFGFSGDSFLASFLSLAGAFFVVFSAFFSDANDVFCFSADS